MDMGDEDEDDEKVCTSGGFFIEFFCRSLLTEHLYFYMPMNTNKLALFLHVD